MKEQKKDEKKLMTIEELAEMLKVQESFVRRKIFLREIPFIKMGRYIRFDIEVVEKWLKKQTKEAA